MPRWRTRLAVGLVSMSVLALELAMMRALSLRFWHHFAYMVISVAMLGFGASGTAITLLRRRILMRPRPSTPVRRGSGRPELAEGRLWLAMLAAAFALSIPLTLLASQYVPLDLEFLAWDPASAFGGLLLELLMFVPFFLGAAVIAIALLDSPRRVTGHYVANLIGSGVGAIGAVGLMYVLDTPQLMFASAAVGFLGAAAVLPWRRPAVATLGALVAAAVVALGVWAPYRPVVSQFKKLSFLIDAEGAEVVYRAEGPLGRIDVVAGPAVHEAPGLNPESTLSFGPLPPHVVVLLDGDHLGPIYDCKRPEQWAFMDLTTSAVAYAVKKGSDPFSGGRVLILGAATGEAIGLALFHGSDEVVALERNQQVVDTVAGRFASAGGDIYRAKGVSVVIAEARAFLDSTDERFDIIQLPIVGDSAGGLLASRESYDYTIEAFVAMLERLADDGLLCVTVSRQTPPREELRAFDTAAAALERLGLQPAERLVMIRNMFTVTVLASKRPFAPEELEAIRAFCRDERRIFDLCYLPGMRKAEANVFEPLHRPYYYEAAEALLGAGREQFLSDYVFDVAAVTDEKPFFFHFFRWKGLLALSEQLGRQSRAFIELGYLTLIAALGQAVVVGAVLIVLPLAPGIDAIVGVKRRTVTLGYFLMIGAGFMMLEMGFLQKLTLYLGHPIFSAAVVISGFLVFAGLGSLLSQRWRGDVRRSAGIAGALTAAAGIVYVFFMDDWLALTQAQPMPLRFVIAAVTIAPLAAAMGHMFPLALRQLGVAAPAMVPWVWAVNGFASVVATVGAPLMAMHWGFSTLALAAVGCYVVAASLARLLPASADCTAPIGASHGPVA